MRSWENSGPDTFPRGMVIPESTVLVILLRTTPTLNSASVAPKRVTCHSSAKYWRRTGAHSKKNVRLASKLPALLRFREYRRRSCSTQNSLNVSHRERSTVGVVHAEIELWKNETTPKPIRNSQGQTRIQTLIEVAAQLELSLKSARRSAEAPDLTVRVA